MNWDEYEKEELKSSLSSIERSVKKVASFCETLSIAFWGLAGFGMLSLIWSIREGIAVFLYTVFIGIPAIVYRFFANSSSDSSTRYLAEQSDWALAGQVYFALLVFIGIGVYSNWRDSKKKSIKKDSNG